MSLLEFIFVCPHLWKRICKTKGPYAVRHLQARYPGNTFLILPQSLDWYPFRETEFDPFLNSFVETLQEESLQIASIKPEAYCLWGCLTRELKGRLDSDTVWAIAVATTLSQDERLNIKYLTRRKIGAPFEVPEIIYQDSQT